MSGSPSVACSGDVLLYGSADSLVSAAAVAPALPAARAAAPGAARAAAGEPAASTTEAATSARCAAPRRAGTRDNRLLPSGTARPHRRARGCVTVWLQAQQT